MKHLIFGVALLLSSAVEAQFPNLPYNPDENSDALIGVVDLQGLLANYGSEFSSAIISEDGESAVVFMGEMEYPHCKYSCDHLPGMWHLPEVEDLVPVWTEASAYPYTWLQPSEYVSNSTGTGTGFQRRYRYASAERSNIASGHHGSHLCYCVAKQMKRVEYFTCKASCSEGPAALDACVNDKLVEGWYPLQSQRQQQVYNDCFWQALWRWAE